MSELLSFHPLADIFPLIEGEEFDALVADIAANGLSQPIVVLDNQILDGRNRYRACLKAGVQHRIRPYQGEDPLAFVISANLHRRHLDESQRAMVAAKLAKLRQGARTDLSPIGEMSQQQAADMLNVGKRSVERAAEVQAHGAAELRHAVERGEVSVSAAADVATLPKGEQVEIVARGEREILQAAKEIRGRRAEKRRDERIARLVEISKGNKALNTAQTYSIVLADPPWRYAKDGIVVMLVPPKGDKVSRALAVQPMFAQNLIYAPRLDWADDLVIAEMAQFPFGARDDLTDSATQALGFLRRTGRIVTDDEVRAEQILSATHQSPRKRLYPI